MGQWVRTGGCVGVEGSSFLPSAALFHYRQPAMNYTEPVNTSIIKHRGVKDEGCVCVGLNRLKAFRVFLDVLQCCQTFDTHSSQQIWVNVLVKFFFCGKQAESFPMFPASVCCHCVVVRQRQQTRLHTHWRTHTNTLCLSQESERLRKHRARRWRYSKYLYTHHPTVCHSILCVCSCIACVCSCIVCVCWTELGVVTHDPKPNRLWMNSGFCFTSQAWFLIPKSKDSNQNKKQICGCE